MTSSPTKVLILPQSDEMRHPYEHALGTLGVEVLWAESVEKMLAIEVGAGPWVLVVDIDVLDSPIEPQVEQLRAHFRKSELIALSSTDSSQLALQCLRAGFTDFLLKPASPEELTWRVRNCEQRTTVLSRIERNKASLVGTVAQISHASTPSLVRLFTLEYLQRRFNAAGAVWLRREPNTSDVPTVVCALPRGLPGAEAIKLSQISDAALLARQPTVTIKKKSRTRKLFLPCQEPFHGEIVLWGIPREISSQGLRRAALVVEHSELSLVHLNKLEEIKHQTFVDDLTGLYNSRYLKFALTHSIARCKDPGQRFSVLFIDVDHFKNINDRYSHLVGSEFLVAIGRTIKHAVRRIDPVFRYGGDEFVVILNGTGVEGAREIAERIRKNIERRIFVIQEKRIQTTVSIGLATYPEHTADRETLLKLADEAMYSAKRHTRNAVHLANVDLSS